MRLRVSSEDSWGYIVILPVLMAILINIPCYPLLFLTGCHRHIKLLCWLFFAISRIIQSVSIVIVA